MPKDLGAIKAEIKKHLDSKPDGYWWDDAIDHLIANPHLLTDLQRIAKGNEDGRL